MPTKSRSVDLDSMLPESGSVPAARRVVTPPANKSNKDLYTPHAIPLTEVQWYAIIHASELDTGVKLKLDKKSKDTRKVTIPLTDKQYANFNAGRTITVSFRQLTYMRSGGFLASLVGLLAESPVLASLAAELAKPIIKEVGSLGAKAVNKLGDSIGLGVKGSSPKRRGNSTLSICGAMK